MCLSITDGAARVAALCAAFSRLRARRLALDVAGRAGV
jgi:hypothetical protein